MLKNSFVSAMCSLILAGCSSLSPTPASGPLFTPTLQTAPTPTPTLAASPSPEPTLNLSPAPPQVCSPLAGTSFDLLAGMVVNPYHPPPPGSDDPHQGLDLAQVSGTDGIALAGMSVQAVLAGRIAGLAVDRFPYGNMLIIETPLQDLALDVPPSLNLPTPLPARLPPGTLSCPDLTVLPSAAGEPRSLYILYAHMQRPGEVGLGDEIQCGQEIGRIGDSGNALNPHLHIEVRIGPANLTFPSMAHYDPSADADEMAAYCAWRVSGVFQTINPACLWGDCD